MYLNPEQIAHINIVNWFNEEFPHLKDDFHHFANERRCSIQQGKLLKRMGVKKGVADFHLAFPTDSYNGLWLELKVGNGTLSKEQKEFINRKNHRGYFSIAAWGELAAKDLISHYVENNITNYYYIAQKYQYKIYTNS